MKLPEKQWHKLEEISVVGTLDIIFNEIKGRGPPMAWCNKQENNQKFQQGQVSAEDIKNDPEKVKEQVITDYAAQKAQAEKEKQMIEQVQNYQK